MSNGVSFDDAITLALDVNMPTVLTPQQTRTYLKLDCVVGETYVFQTYGDFDAYATLFDENRTYVKYDDNGIDANPFIPFKATTPIMYIELSGNNDPTEHTIVTANFKIYDASQVVSLTITPNPFRVRVGETIQLRVHVEPESASNVEVVWHLADAMSTGMIDRNGMVIGWNEGYIEVYVRALGGLIEARGSGIVGPYNDGNGQLKCISLDDITFVHGRHVDGGYPG